MIKMIKIMGTCLTETKSWSQLPPPLERHHSAQLVLLQGDHNDDSDDDDIYIMMTCLFVCNEKSSLPPVSLL